MSSLKECYDILGVSFGIGMADLTSSYKRLCRLYHPDVNRDPDSEERMKKINTAYSVIRDKLIREASLYERMNHPRQHRRYSYDAGGSGAQQRQTRYGADTDKDKDKAARSVLNDYFNALKTFDYQAAYSLLSNYDRRVITIDGFIRWRESVTRLYTLLGFNIAEGTASTTIVFNETKRCPARRFKITVNEENTAGEKSETGTIEKLMINEYGAWKVLLGFDNVIELAREFDEQFETKRRLDINKVWNEHYSKHYQQFNILSLAGLRKAAAKEIYRQNRFGGALTLALFSITLSGAKRSLMEPLLRSAAGTIASALREIDIIAYVGDGVFAVLFVELKKKNAGEITKRLAARIRKDAGEYLGGQADIDCTFKSWSGAGSCSIPALNEALGSVNNSS